MRRAGREMAKEIPRSGRWSAARFKTTQQQGEEMLREQLALEEKDRLVRLVKIQGDISPMRSHVAKNIHTRLTDEKDREVTDVLNIQQQCMNIRKHLASMVNSRRELAGLRVRVQQLTEDNDPQQQQLLDLGSLSFGFRDDGSSAAKKGAEGAAEEP